MKRKLLILFITSLVFSLSAMEKKHKKKTKRTSSHSSREMLTPTKKKDHIRILSLHPLDNQLLAIYKRSQDTFMGHENIMMLYDFENEKFMELESEIPIFFKATFLSNDNQILFSSNTLDEIKAHSTDPLQKLWQIQTSTEMTGVDKVGDDKVCCSFEEGSFKIYDKEGTLESEFQANNYEPVHFLRICGDRLITTGSTHIKCWQEANDDIYDETTECWCWSNSKKWKKIGDYQYFQYSLFANQAKTEIECLDMNAQGDRLLVCFKEDNNFIAKLFELPSFKQIDTLSLYKQRNIEFNMGFSSEGDKCYLIQKAAMRPKEKTETLRFYEKKETTSDDQKPALKLIKIFNSETGELLEERYLESCKETSINEKHTNKNLTQSTYDVLALTEFKAHSDNESILLYGEEGKVIKITPSRKQKKWSNDLDKFSKKEITVITFE